MHAVNISRRNFLKTSGLAGGGLIVGFSLSACESEVGASLIRPVAGAFVANAFLQITPTNAVHFYCPRAEMGQGINTGLTTLIAEELDISPANIQVETVGAHVDYKNLLYDIQATGGSTSMRAHYTQLRQVGANARQALINAAAKDMNISVKDITTQNGYIIAKGQKYPYGDFATTAQSMPPALAQAPLTAKKDFKYIGLSHVRRVDAVAKSTGTAVYGIDIDIPDMHYAVVKRPPVANSKVKSFNKAGIAHMPGVIGVFEVITGVAVVAKKYWQAKQAATQLEVQWHLPELAQFSSNQIKADYQQALAKKEGDSEVLQGDLEQGFAAADKTIESKFWAPYLAHAPMEPMNAVVRIKNGEADVWAGTQGIGLVPRLVARYSGLPETRIRAHNTYLGGGFGRRITAEYIIEATQAAMAVNKPVKVLWSREDDIQNGYYRPASLMNIKAGIDNTGAIVAWQATRVGGNIMPNSLQVGLPGTVPNVVPDGIINLLVGTARHVFDGWQVDHSSIEGLYEDYDLPNREVLHITKNHGLPLMYWRSVGHSFTAFAKEVIVDELIREGGHDAVDFRLNNTRNNPRLNSVIKVAGNKMRTMKTAPGHSLGLAAHGSFGSYVAEIADVSVDSSHNIRVHKIVCVIDCGQVVNPDVVRAQMEGAVMFGLTAALHGNIELKKGQVTASNFHNYPILRMNEAPKVEVILMDSDQSPTGVGEPGLPPVAPAVANAVFAATGQRLRSLPLKLS